MTISPIGQAVSAQETSGSSGSMISSDFTTFLKMLTVQMQNQNPLNPIESSDYAVQLATFSGVEQQVQTNNLLSAMNQQFSLMGMSQFAGWIGHDARASADIWFKGSAVTLSPNPEINADQAFLVVKDSKGNVLTREELPVSTDPYIWMGADGEGDPLPEGRYALSLESWRGGQLSRVDPIESYQKIIEARGGISETIIVLEGGIEVASSKITALRRQD